MVVKNSIVNLSLACGKQLQEKTFAAVGKAFSALPCDYSVLPVAAETVDNYQNAGEGGEGREGRVDDRVDHITTSSKSTKLC